MGYFHDPFRASAGDKQNAAETPEEPKETGPVVPSGSTKEVLAWVGEDKERAQAALDRENSHDDPRKGLVKELEKLV